jgi:neuropeptide Y receptor
MASRLTDTGNGSLNSKEAAANSGGIRAQGGDIVRATMSNLVEAVVNNITLNDTDNNTTDIPHELIEREDVMKAPWLRAIFIILYCLIFTLGVSGNFLVVFVVIRNKTMQTITNIFIANLAVSDIMMCLLAVPFTPLSAFLESWAFGDALCHLVPMALGVSVYVSTLTSTAIAIDRYFVIVHPFKPRMKIFVCLLLIVAVWIISISISLPLAIYQRVIWDEKDAAYYCYEYWPKTTARQFFTVTSLILQYIVPCSIIIFCYTKVSLVLKARSRVRIGCGSANRDRDEMEIRRKRRTNKMLIAMVSIFVCCWLPLNAVHIITEYYGSIKSWNYYVLLFFAAHVIAMSSTIYNPFLYAWMNENFRKEFKAIVPCLFIRGRHTNMNGTSTYTTVETQHSIVHRSPTRTDRNGHNCNNSFNKDTTATYEAESEKVHLKVAGGDEEC